MIWGCDSASMPTPSPLSHTNTCHGSLLFTMTHMANVLTTEQSAEQNLNGGEGERMKRRRGVYQTSRCPFYICCSLCPWGECVFRSIQYIYVNNTMSMWALVVLKCLKQHKLIAMILFWHEKGWFDFSNQKEVWNIVSVSLKNLCVWCYEEYFITLLNYT